MRITHGTHYIGMMFAAAVVLLALSGQVHGAGCSFTVGSSNTSTYLNGTECNHGTLVFSKEVSNATLVCTGAGGFDGNYTIVVGSRDVADRIVNCSIDGPVVVMGNDSSLYVVGTNRPVFTPRFRYNSSNITVAHYLTVRVFEPYGSNTTGVFGQRVAGFSYIFPTMNGSFSSNNTELQMGEFFNNFTARFSTFQQSIPFGAYNINESQIWGNYTERLPYGKIVGRKTFLLPQYTLTRSGRVDYNPYEIDYSFIGFDQLVTFTLNVTENMNLTPFYIQPVYPSFNFNILPDNGTQNMTIRWLVAVPPEDAGWNFTAYLYRYNPTEFVLNPSDGVGAHSILYRAFSFPGSAPDSGQNGTMIYYVNYTQRMPVGINSSIMMLPGTIPGLGRFVEDSTTPSFSRGLGYCALANDLSVPMSYIRVSSPGTYNMVHRLLPIAQAALPQLVNNACSVGVVISGSGITINCDNGRINDTVTGILIENSSDVTLNDCRIHGNGVRIVNSSGITVNNLNLTPGASGDFGIDIRDTQGVTFNNLTINNGYKSPFSVFSSAGTPFSEAISVYNLSSCGSENLSAIKQVAFVYSYTPTCGNVTLYRIVHGITPVDELVALTVALAAFYAYLIITRRRKSSRSGRRKSTRGSKHGTG